MDSLIGGNFEAILRTTLADTKARIIICLIKSSHSLNNRNFNQIIHCETFPFCKNSSYSEQYSTDGETELKASYVKKAGEKLERCWTKLCALQGF